MIILKLLLAVSLILMPGSGVSYTATNGRVFQATRFGNLVLFRPDLISRIERDVARFPVTSNTHR